MSTILAYSNSFYFRYSAIMSASSCIWLLYCANIFLLISCVVVSSAWMAASRIFIEVSRLVNSLIANLQFERLRVFAEVSSIRALYRLVLTFFYVSFRYFITFSTALCAFFSALQTFILFISSKLSLMYIWLIRLRFALWLLSTVSSPLLAFPSSWTRWWYFPPHNLRKVY